MDDDFNTPRVLALVDKLISEANKTKNTNKLADTEHIIYEMGRVLGLDLQTRIKAKTKIPDA